MEISEVPEILMTPISPGEVVDYKNTYFPPPYVDIIEYVESIVNKRTAFTYSEIKDLFKNAVPP